MLVALSSSNRASRVSSTSYSREYRLVFFWIVRLRSVGSDLAVIGLVGQGTYKYVYWVLLYRDYWETRSHHEVSSFSVLRYTNSITVVPTVGMVLS